MLEEQRKKETIQRCTNVSHIFAVSASHILAYLLRRRVRGRKPFRSGARATSVSTLQDRRVTGTQCLSPSVVIAAEALTEFICNIMTLEDKRYAAHLHHGCWRCQCTRLRCFPSSDSPSRQVSADVARVYRENVQNICAALIFSLFF